uniref:Reverse transcriptase domain-containing protein n=1 Tax=Ascaris lumbricoides TaxID=6252 RepID=A0A0M3HVE0_ASCLU
MTLVRQQECNTDTISLDTKQFDNKETDIETIGNYLQHEVAHELHPHVDRLTEDQPEAIMKVQKNNKKALGSTTQI